MNKQKSKRVTLDDWLQLAVKVLAEDGYNALTVEELATRLKVTRGSFYHHFKSKQELTKKMLEYWIGELTTSIREDVVALDMDGFNSLRSLMLLIRHRKAAAYDVAFRAWAFHDPQVKKVVAEVDAIRMDFIRSQFEKIGFKGIDLENRARLYLFYEMSDPAFFVSIDDKFASRLDEERLIFLTTKTE